MKFFACVPLLFVGASAVLADDVPLEKSFSFRLEEPTLKAPAAPLLVPPASNAAPALPATPEGEKPPRNSTPFRFNGETYYFIMI